MLKRGNSVDKCQQTTDRQSTARLAHATKPPIEASRRTTAVNHESGITDD